MQIYYSPCKATRDTTIQVVSENKLIIDGEEFEFDENSVVWPDISTVTNGKILEARRDTVLATWHDVTNENGVTESIIDVPEHVELFVKVLRFYSGACPWDTGRYGTAEIVC